MVAAAAAAVDVFDFVVRFFILARRNKEILFSCACNLPPRKVPPEFLDLFANSSCNSLNSLKRVSYSVFLVL